MVEVPVIHEVVKPCLTEAPPEMEPVGVPHECVPGFLCYALTDAVTLFDNVTTLHDRVRDDWTKCGVAP